MGKLSPDTGAPRPDAAPDAILREAAKDILAALERLHASRTFANSQRLLTFLSFVVEATLRGDGSSLKETTIGVGLFHRDPGYDPKIDSIVRTQASRLRERLAEYYATEGALDPVVIQINRGSYVPVFDRRRFGGAAWNETYDSRQRGGACRSRLAMAAGDLVGGCGRHRDWSCAFAYVATRPRPVPKVLKYTQLTSDGHPKWLAGGDASRLFLGTGTLTSLGIAQLSISRGDLSAFPCRFRSLYLLGASTDGAELLGEEYPANTPDYPGRLWSVPVIGGPPQIGPCWRTMLPGRRTEHARLLQPRRPFLAKNDGTEARKLASVAGLAYAPQVSPTAREFVSASWT